MGGSAPFARPVGALARAAALLTLVSVATPGALARDPAPAPTGQSVALDADGARLQAIESLIGAGRLDEAGAALEAGAFATGYGRLHARFLRAMVRKGRGDFAAARTAFRDILADQPQLARVRLELADTLVSAGAIIPH